MAQPLPESWQPYAEGALHFDAETHTYTLGGKRVPSVTQVLSLAGLVDLRDVPAHILEAARLKGEYVHKACEYLDHDDLDLDALDPALVGYVRAWVRCKEEQGFTIEAIEEPVRYVANGLAFAGTLDRRIMYGDVLGIVDLKSGSRLQPTTALQLAAYDLATCYTHNCHVVQGHARIAVRLCADGTYEWKVYGDAEDHRVFLAALETAWWRLAHDAKARR